MNRFTLALALFVFFHAVAGADEPSVSYVFPAGGQRGTTVEFRVGGHYLHEACPFEMLGPGVSASAQLKRADRTIWFEGPVIPLPDSQQKEDYPADHLGSVQIAADASPGIRRWRVRTSQGVTASMPFVIGELPEIVEEEIDGRPIPTLVQPPLTINGRTFPREDVDIWSFDAQAGESFVCEVHAARIGSPVDSWLKVVDPDGRTIAENDDSLGKDSRVVFIAEKSGRYEVHLWDADLGGLQHFVYRLSITRGPLVESVFPLGGRRGETLRASLVQNDGSESLAAATEPIDLPIAADAAERVPVPSVLGVWIEASDAAERVEQEPNNAMEEATAIGPANVGDDASANLGVILNGRIQSPGDVDFWAINATKDVPVDIDLRAARLGSPLDSVLAVRDADGKQLAENDDLAAGQSDSRLTFAPPSDGVYFITVADRFADRGDARFAYRIHIRPATSKAPSFALKLPSDALNVARGGESKMKIAVERLHGFTGAIQVVAEGLPAGVTVAEATIAANQNDATLTFKAESEAPIGAARLRIVGRSEIDGAPIERVARLPAASPDDMEMDHLLLGVALPTPFKVVGDFETKYAARGSTFVRHYRIERGGYEGPLVVRLAERQVRHLQGVNGPTIEVPAGASEFDFPVQLPPWMEIGRTSRTCVMAIGRVDLPDGTQHTVSYTSHEQNDQIIVLVDPGQLSLRLDRSSILASPGNTVDLPFEIQRGQELAGDVRIELVVAEHIRGVDCDPIQLGSGTDRGLLSIRFLEDPKGPFNMPLVVRAVGSRGGHPYTAEAPLEVVAPAPIVAR